MFTNVEKEGKMPAASRGNAACQARKKCLIKREPRHLLDTGTWAGTARLAPPCTAAKALLIFGPDPSHWAGVNC